MKLRVTIIATAAILLVSSCSSSGTPKPTASAGGAPSATETPTPEALPTESPTEIGSTVISLGDTTQISYTDGPGTGSLTVYSYKQPVASSAPRPQTSGYTWGAIDVKECAGENDTVNNSPWTLVYGDDTQLEPSSLGYNQFPEPEFPFGDKNLPSGRCVRGWIVFPVPKTTKPTMVEFALGGDGSVIDWQL